MLNARFATRSGHRRVRTLVLALALGFAGAAGAAVPATIALQAKLTSAGGSPAPDGDYLVVVTLWTDETDGAQVWKENLGAVARDGIVNLVLGESVSFTPDVLAAGPRFVQVQVGSEPPLPRVPLHSVPYALEARSVACTACIGAEQLDVSAVSLALDTAGFARLSELSSVALSGAFGDLIAIPTGLADGDDDTTYSGTDFALSNQACPAGQVAAGVDGTGHVVCTQTASKVDIDLAWMSIHAAAAAACRGSTPSGGSGCCGNTVRVRNTASNLTCTQICSASSEICDAEVSVWGMPGKATSNGQAVGSFYNYACSGSGNGGSEATTVNASDVLTVGYWSYCCCRK